MTNYRGLYNSTDFTGDYIDVSQINTDTIQLKADSDQLLLGTNGVTTISCLSSSDRTLTIPLSNGDGQFVLTNSDVDQIIGGDNTFTGSNTFEQTTTFETNILIDTINEYTNNNGVNIDGVILKDGLIYDTNYNIGVLHSDLNGNITSSNIVDGDIDDNTITFSKIQQISNNKALGNITGITNDIQQIDLLSTSSNNSIMLRDSSSNTQVNEISLNQINSLTNSYIMVKNVKIDTDLLADESSNDFFIVNRGGGYLVLKNEIGETYVASDTDNVHLISYDSSKYIICGNILQCGNGIQTDNIYEYTLNNGVNIDGLIIKDGLFNDTNYTTGYLISDTNGIITSTDIDVVIYDISKDIIVNHIDCYGSVATQYIESSDGLYIEQYGNNNITISNTGIGDIDIISNNGDILISCVNEYHKINMNCFDLYLDVNRLTINYLKSVGVLHSNIYGQLSTSLITNDDINIGTITYDKLNLTNSIVNNDIVNNTLTFAKIQQINNNKLLGNISGGIANISEIDVSTSAGANTVVRRDALGDISVNNIYNDRIYPISASASLPSYSFNGNTQCGMYAESTNTLAWSTAAAKRMTLNNNNLTINLNGSASLPALAINQNGLGIYRSATDTMNFSTGLNSRLQMDNSRALFSYSGTAALPAICLRSASNAGIYSSATDLIGISTNGIGRMQATNTGISIINGTLSSDNNTLTNISSTTITNSLGSVSNPSYTFTGDSNTGIYSPGADQLNIVTNGANRVECTNSGVIINGNLSISGTNNDTPIGSLIMYISTVPPNFKWLICDGSAISRTTYSVLWAIIGTTYGAGDGSTTFNIPNFSQRMPFGYSSPSFNMGTTGGATTKTLATSELPSHTHSASGLTISGLSGNQFFCTEATGSNDPNWKNGTLAGFNRTTLGTLSVGGNTASTGSGTSFSILNPYLSVSFIIKVL